MLNEPEYYLFIDPVNIVNIISLLFHHHHHPLTAFLCIGGSEVIRKLLHNFVRLLGTLDRVGDFVLEIRLIVAAIVVVVVAATVAVLIDLFVRG